MKQSIIKIVSAVMLSGAFMFATSGCEKTLNNPVENNATASDAMLADIKCPEIPDTLQVPEGNKLVLHTYATGVQIYQVQRSLTNSNAFLWVNIAPSATLYAKANYTNQLGIHYAGPTWEFTKGMYKGEKVVATKLKAVTEDITAIPWLLLKTVDSLSSADNKITYIQRLYTEGGLAPATGADEDHLGQLESIPYTALYLFYEAKQ